MFCFLYTDDVIVEEEHKKNPPQKNAFAVMMKAARELEFPPRLFSTPKRYEVGRGDHYLHDIIYFLKEKSQGFSTGNENTTRKQVVKILTNASYIICIHE